ncbi:MULTISPECIES: MsnO8 family LLM class oxidoreductase [Protofrankia]|uniref:MsnO8 family LLM class oxidoreductase n=1 Tax=Protofrankia TaxID=2994361 RepID=UPI000B0A3934|nr:MULTISPECIES: MsnO8 family LLM class oxidoreductase [Protofrankia]
MLSVLDQGPVRRDAGPRQAIHDSVTVARELDTAGYARYWVAEHHGTASRAISAPEVLIGAIASATTRSRVGAGGTMLPNHTPLHVAEQFRILHTLYPGRIDLGVGRATGATDAVTGAAPARGLQGDPAPARGLQQDRDVFDASLRELLAFGGRREFPAGAAAGDADIRVMPDDVPLPPVYLLGSSASAARTAAALGLPYAMTAGFRDPALAVEGLRLYRQRFTPARDGDHPYAIVVLRAWVGDDREHAEALAAPERLANVWQLAGDAAALVPVHEALAYRFSEPERAVRDRLDLRSDLVGGPAEVADQLAALAGASGADEVMLVTNTYEPADRVASFRRLAAAVGLAAPASA